MKHVQPGTIKCRQTYPTFSHMHDLLPYRITVKTFLRSVQDELPQFVCVLILIYDIFVNCNWVDTRWQWYSTHLHTNNTQNNTM